MPWAFGTYAGAYPVVGPLPAATAGSLNASTGSMTYGKKKNSAVVPPPRPYLLEMPCMTRTVRMIPGMKSAMYPIVIQRTHQPDFPQHFTNVYVCT